jgi:hypothetical protein
MINEEKVILMTKLAAYEEGKGKEDIHILNYFRSDYLGFQILKAVIAATISFLAILAVYIFYNFEVLMQDIYEMDLLSLGRTVITLYLCLLGIHGVITYVIYAGKYRRAKNSLRAYYANLKKLVNMYDR